MAIADWIPEPSAMCLPNCDNGQSIAMNCIVISSCVCAVCVGEPNTNNSI